MRDGVLTARCSTWWAQSNWALIDCPTDAADFLLPAWFWNTDRTAEGAQVIDASKGTSLDRTELQSGWGTGRFSQVGTYGGATMARNLTIIVSGVSVDRPAFDRLTKGMALDPAAKLPPDELMQSVSPPGAGKRMRGNGPAQTFDRERALAALGARANDGGLGINPLFGKRGDQAIIERMVAEHFADLGHEPAVSTIRPIAQIAIDAVEHHRRRRLMDDNSD
ncbi:hypothetical protein A0J57_18170 [Sphingobium sp. 22B]|nr:hypothetical protein AXW74_20430 [Sphingobium sp. AM]KYC30918.1 hypothetical protein A0J57_18170 [Sphingobium sp. 22B]OAP30450.1 hypothetical protein A8O16_18460 [Sphingobium sp. 20006FA]